MQMAVDIINLTFKLYRVLRQKFEKLKDVIHFNFVCLIDSHLISKIGIHSKHHKDENSTKYLKSQIVITAILNNIVFPSAKWEVIRYTNA